MDQYQHRSKQELIRELEQMKTRLLKEPIGKEYNIAEQDLQQYLPEVKGEELFLLTETGRVVFANDIMLGSLGLDREELIGKSLSDIDQNFRRSTWLSNVSNLKHSGKPFVFESRQRTVDSMIRTIEVAATYIKHDGKNYILCVGREKDDAPLDVVGASQDTSGIALPPSREQAILNIVNEGILLVDGKGTIVDTNTAACKILGLPKSEIIRRSCVDPKWRYLDAQGDIMKLSDHPIMVALVEEEPVLNRRVSIMQSDGEMRAFLLSVTPLFDSNRMITGAVATFRSPQASTEQLGAVRSFSSGNTFHTDLLHTLTHAETLDEFERGICREIQAFGSYPLVWLGTTKPNNPKIHASVSVGSASEYLLKIRMRYDDSEQGKSPAGECIRTRRPQIVHDIETDPRYVIWKKQASKMGLHSSAYFPVLLPDDSLKVLCVYADETEHFTPDRMDLLRTAADVLAYGTGTFHARLKLVELQTLAVVHAQLSDALHSGTRTAIGLFEAKSPYRMLYANAAYCGLLDEPYKSGGVEKLSAMDIAYCHQHKSLIQELESCIAEGERVSRQSDVFRNWDGTETAWDWELLPCRVGGDIDQVLYIANRTPGSGTSELAEGDRQAEKGISVPADADLPEGEILIGITMPTPKPRSRKQTRITQFYKEGKIITYNDAALIFCGVNEPSGNATFTPDEFFPDDPTFRHAFEEGFVAGDPAFSFPVSSLVFDEFSPKRCDVEVEHSDGGTSNIRLTLH